MSINAVHISAPATATRVNWGPYLAGIGIGVLSWIVFAVVNNPLGITTAISQVSGGVASLIVGADVVAANKYWAKNAFSLDYGTLFLVGTLLGGLGSALAAGTWRLETVPRVWAERFGPSPARRYGVAFIGGILYALTFDWVSQAILPVWALGKVQLPQLLGVGAPVVFVVLGLLVIAFFVILERR